MSENVSRRLITTIIVSGLGTLIGYAISFFITPFITTNLGIDAYSFVTMANTAVMYAGVITIALTSFVVRYIVLAYHKGEIEEARSYYSSSIVASIALSGILFGIAAILISQLQNLLIIPELLVNSVKLLFLLVFLNFVVTTITTPFTATFYVRNRLDINAFVRLTAKIIEATGVFLLFFLCPTKLWYVAIGAIAGSTVIIVVSIFLTKKLTPELAFKRHDVSFSKMVTLFKNGIWNSMNQLGNVLNSGLDLIVANRMLSSIETGQIAVGKTVGSYFSVLIQLVSQPFEPILLKSYASGDIVDFQKHMSKAMKFCGFFGAMAFAGFCGVGLNFFHLWLPNEDHYVLYVLTVLTVVTCVTDSILRPVYYISTLTVKNKIPCIITIVGGVLNVLSMYLLIKYTNLGVYTVAITTIVIMFLINLVFNPLYAAHCIKINSWFFYKILIVHLIASAVMAGSLFGLNYLMSTSSWLTLVLEGLLFVLIGTIIYFLIVFNIDEKRAIIGKIKRVFIKEKIQE